MRTVYIVVLKRGPWTMVLAGDQLFSLRPDAASEFATLPDAARVASIMEQDFGLQLEVLAAPAMRRKGRAA